MERKPTGYCKYMHDDSKNNIMIGMQIAISNEKDKDVQKLMIYQFRRIEKFLGYEENSWRHFA